MSYRAFLSEIEKGLPAPVYLFSVTDPFLQKEAIDGIKGLVPENERDFNLHIFDLSAQGDETPTVTATVDVANTVSFFGGRRITIIIANLQKLIKKDVERLNHYLENPAPNSGFIIFHQGTFGKQIRNKFKGLKPVPLDIRESEVHHWMKQRARMKGIQISEEAIDYLISLIGSDLGLLSSEIDKIALLGITRININDISDIITGGRVYGIFDLVNALRQKAPEKVFKIYRVLKETSDDYSLIGALNWQYGRFIKAESKQKEQEHFLRIFELLNAVDLDIKSSGRTYPVEILLIKLLRLQERLPGAEARLPAW
jgi:DNA polymerase-3 subunit delta